MLTKERAFVFWSLFPLSLSLSLFYEVNIGSRTYGVNRLLTKRKKRGCKSFLAFLFDGVFLSGEKLRISESFFIQFFLKK